jgi:diphthamide synthase (EF-2-diphthine--ammonia ligase)
MIDDNMNAILIKVCTMGLDETDLLISIADLKDKLFMLEKKYQINVCGEGGEFETLTLDCPLYKKKIDMHFNNSEKSMKSSATQKMHFQVYTILRYLTIV